MITSSCSHQLSNSGERDLKSPVVFLLLSMMSDYLEAKEGPSSEAIQHKTWHPGAGFRWLANHFGLNKDRIHRRRIGVQ
jgi:hypothetical protein